MKSKLYELIGLQATQPNTGAACTIAANSGTTTLQLRNSNKRPNLRQIWSKHQVAGFFQPILNSQHDTTRNFRFNSPINSLAMHTAWDLDMRANSNETIVATISGSNVAGDVETACILAEYDELGGMQGAYIDDKELLEMQSGILTTVNLALTGAAVAGGGWTGALAVSAGAASLLKAGKDYALLGITTDINSAAISIQGPCTGNYRYGLPGDSLQIERQHQWFKVASTLSGQAMIPVLNANDAASTQIAILSDENAISPNVTLHLALLK